MSKSFESQWQALAMCSLLTDCQHWLGQPLHWLPWNDNADLWHHAQLADLNPDSKSNLTQTLQPKHLVSFTRLAGDFTICCQTWFSWNHWLRRCKHSCQSSIGWYEVAQGTNCRTSCSRIHNATLQRCYWEVLGQKVHPWLTTLPRVIANLTDAHQVRLGYRSVADACILFW